MDFGDNWNYFTGTDWFFNETKLATQFFNASVIATVTGTPQGAIEDIRSYNLIPYNVSEDASDLLLAVNFTGITDFNNLIIRYKSEEEDEPHIMAVQIYDYSDSDWEDYGTLPTNAVYQVVHFGVYDASEHIDGGIVQVRFYQDGGTPPRTHKHLFDWVTISLGYGAPAQDEVDPIFFDWFELKL
ncbi:unnamed protein product [marine sediment metagenome]|uniref:Uncharacterized protein n=1 Tax=marine sediment metagenome TaxID=412755 RepID=X1B2T8_9ZZZZ